MIRKLVGLPSIKKQSRVNLQKRSRYRKTRNSTKPTEKKRPTQFEQGFQIARDVAESWNSQANPPQVYVLDRRVHHGELGVITGIVGILKNDPYWTGFGAGLTLDDLPDAKEWFTFKKREPFSPLI